MDQALRTAIFAAAAAALASALAYAADAGALGLGVATALGAFLGAFFAARRDAQTPLDDAPANPAAPTRAVDAPALMRLPAPVLLVDRSLRVRVANDEARAVFGAIGSDGRLSTLIRSPDFLEATERALETGADDDLAFMHRQSKDEREMLARIRYVPAHPIFGEVAAIQFDDQSRARSLEAVRETFIANASHELKTPLASIIGFIETLQGPAKDDAGAREKFLGIMAQQADRMRRLVDDLMSLNRIEMNVHVRPRETVDLCALAHETAAAMEPLARAAAAEIHVAAPETGARIAGDRDQLSQLLTNLMDNAVKYGGEGARVDVTLAEPQPEWPGMVGLTIKDDGPGIPREHLPRLTERFYRVDAARSRMVGGTGLGLAIVKHILQRHRGDLSIRSANGEGSAFTVWFPEVGQIR
ncbi:MAG: ATP-binding protein [Pseudomonadota bacterium]